MDNGVICSLPFYKIYNGLNMGSYTPCCWSEKWFDDKNPTNTLPIDYFTGEEFSRLRKEMLEGKKTDFLKSHCGNCWMREEKFGDSPRLKNLDRFNTNLISNFNPDGTIINNETRFINIAINVYGNFCNLECYECMPANSSSRISVLEKLNDSQLNDVFKFDARKTKKLDSNQFEKIIDELVSYSYKIESISIVGGEPMLMKSHFKLLDKLIECEQSKFIELNYVSNVTLMKLSSMKKYFDNFMFTRIQWSVDALKERNYWLRYPTNWETTTKNAEEINKYLVKNNCGEILATITPSLFSITTFKETSDWLIVNGYNQAHMNLVVDPDFLSPQHLPQELKEKISNKIRKISPIHYNQLMSSGSEKKFKYAIKYADKLDASRGTDWRSIFPEIAQYTN